jgi:RNA polymerase nonessential primary-like sigma factor
MVFDAGVRRALARKEGRCSIKHRDRSPEIPESYGNSYYGKSRSLTMYLQGMNDYPVLETAEQKELVKAIKRDLEDLRHYVVSERSDGLDIADFCSESDRPDLSDMVEHLRGYARSGNGRVRYAFVYRYSDDSPSDLLEDIFDEISGDKTGQIVRICLQDMLATCRIYAHGLWDAANSAIEPEQRESRYRESDEILSKIDEYVSLRERFINSHLRLAVTFCGDPAFRRSKVELEDRIQEANIGLMRSLDMFDPYRGYKFSTYSRWWVRQALSEARGTIGRLIRLPPHIYDKYHKIFLAGILLEREGIMRPTAKQIADKLGWDENKVLALQKIPRDNIVSLHEVVYRGEDAKTLADILPDTDAAMADSEVERSEVFDVLERYVKRLPLQRRIVIVYRIGLPADGFFSVEECMASTKYSYEQFEALRECQAKKIEAGEDSSLTLQEIADILEVSRQRVSQVEIDSLKALRKSGLLNDLDGHDLSSFISDESKHAQDAGDGDETLE